MRMEWAWQVAGHSKRRKYMGLGFWRFWGGGWQGENALFGKNRTFCVSEKRAQWVFHVLMKAKTMNMINRKPDGVWPSGAWNLMRSPERVDRGGRRQVIERGCDRDGCSPGGDDGTFRYFPVLSGGEKKRVGHIRIKNTKEMITAKGAKYTKRKTGWTG
jgi:hypothetical protein